MRAGRSRIDSPSACRSSRAGWRATTSLARTRSNPSSESGGLPRLEFRIERLRTTCRFTYAFHAREVRFERDSGDGFESVFPETFSFHADRHDPAELYLRLEDLWTNPTRLEPRANRRDAEELMLRLLEGLPRTLDGVLDRLEEGSAAARTRAAEDVATFCQVVQRFLVDKSLLESSRLRFSAAYLRKLLLRSLRIVVESRVQPDSIERYVEGEAEVERPADPTDLGFFYALASDDAARIDASLIGATERAYHRWLEEICLDPDNRLFESERSPFADREEEVMAAMAADGVGPVDTAGELSTFLRRPQDRDCLRLLKRLETWFLRQYDIHHAAVVLHQGEGLRRGPDQPDRVLTRHGTRTYAATLILPSLPFVGAALAYDRAPEIFDLLASAMVVFVLAGAVWFLFYRFMWKKDLSFFHSSVPRIAAGIIVGYLPVFLIDEVWDLAEQTPAFLIPTVMLLGSVTLLYLYVEVRSKIGDPLESFARARDLFLLGLIQASGFGIAVTSLIGPLMAGRNWATSGAMTVSALNETLPPFIGELPRVLGVAPFSAFPTAVLLMSFMAFFIGTFLQLLWEELPITEPM